MSSIWVVKLVTKGGLLDAVWDDDQTDQMVSGGEKSLTLVMSTLKSGPQHTHFMLFREQGREKQDPTTINKIRLWWNDLIEKRLPPQSHVIDPETGRVDVDIDCDDVATIGNHLYAQYTPAEEQALEREFNFNDPIGHPVIFPEHPQAIRAIEAQTYFASPKDLEARLKLGIAHEYQFLKTQIQDYGNRDVRVMMVKATDLPRPGPGEKVKSEIPRNAVFILVISIDPVSQIGPGENDDDVGEHITPPERTEFEINVIPHRQQVQPGEPDGRWRGLVFDHPSTVLKEMGVKFCIFAVKPRDGAHFDGELHDNLEAARDSYFGEVLVALPTMRLTPIFNSHTEEREMAAVTYVCDLNNNLRHVQMPLLYTFERNQPRPVDYALEHSTCKDGKALWEDLFPILQEKLGFEDNIPHWRLMSSLRQLAGGLTLVTGPAGAGKTRLASHMAVMLVLLGYRVILQAREHEAVDNLAFSFDNACQEMEGWLEEAGLHDLVMKLDKIRTLRYATSALFEKQIQQSGEVYQTVQPDPAAYQKDAFVESQIQLLQELESVQVENNTDENISLREERIQAAKAGIIRQKIAYDAVHLKEQKKALKYPGHMSIAAHIERSRIENTSDDQAMDHFKLHDRLVRGEHLTAAERDKLSTQRIQAIIQIITEADVICCTTAASADDILTSCPKFDFAFIDEAGKMSVPLGMVGLSRVKFHCFFLGDPYQIGFELHSHTVNAMKNQFNDSILTFMLKKNCRTIQMNKQYRCAPGVFKLIDQMFYQNSVQTDICTYGPGKEAEPVRQASRAWSLGYGCFESTPKGEIAAEKEIGSLFVGVNVKNGVTVRQERGTSKVNYAEAAAALQVADELLQDPAVKPSDILITTFYRGEIDVIRELQHGFPRTFGVDVKNVDAAQGRTEQIVILVIGVTSHNELNHLFQDDPVFLDMSWKLTAFALYPNRLNVGLSRSSGLMVVVANFYTLATIQPRPQDPVRSGTALKLMASYLLANDLVVDNDVWDQNPRLGMAENEERRASVASVVEKNTTRRLNALQQETKRLRKLRKEEQVSIKGVEQPYIMGNLNIDTAAYPASLNAESQKRQDEGQPVGRAGNRLFANRRKRQRRAQRQSESVLNAPLAQLTLAQPMTRKRSLDEADEKDEKKHKAGDKEMESEESGGD